MLHFYFLAFQRKLSGTGPFFYNACYGLGIGRYILVFLGFSSLQSSTGVVLSFSRPPEMPLVSWKSALIPIFRQFFSKASIVTESEKSTKINFSVICYLYVSMSIVCQGTIGVT